LIEFLHFKVFSQRRWSLFGLGLELWCCTPL